MRTTLAGLLTVPVALAVAACGAGDGGGDGGDAPSPEDGGGNTMTWRDCSPRAVAAADGVLGQVRTAGGDRVEVKLPTNGPCAGGLVAQTGDGVAGLDVADLDLDPATVEVLTPGAGATATQLLRVDGAHHPRGGFQPHLFLVGTQLTELTVDGGPLVPFVATDGGAAPMTVRCAADGTVEVLEATVSEPPGVVLAWDVWRTQYDVGTPVRAGARDQLHEHVADPLLRRDIPEMFDPEALFKGC
jgi:hypothetical protein